MGNVVVPLAVLAGGASLIYVGVADPAGGGFAGIGNLIRGVPNTKRPADPSAFAATEADLQAGSKLGAADPYTGGLDAGTIGQSGPYGAIRAEVLTEAEKWLGVPYVFGGNTKAGVDCSGLTLQVFARVGIHLPRVSYLQAKRGKRTTNPQPGDLVAFGRPVHHVGIYVGNGQMINAPHTGAVVRVEPVDYGAHPIQYRNLVVNKVQHVKGGHA